MNEPDSSDGLTMAGKDAMAEKAAAEKVVVVTDPSAIDALSRLF